MWNTGYKQKSIPHVYFIIQTRVLITTALWTWKNPISSHFKFHSIGSSPFHSECHIKWRQPRKIIRRVNWAAKYPSSLRKQSLDFNSLMSGSLRREWRSDQSVGSRAWDPGWLTPPSSCSPPISQQPVSVSSAAQTKTLIALDMMT